MKKTILFILVCSLLLLCGCASKPFTGLRSGGQTEPGGSAPSPDEVRITLKGDSAEVRGGGAKAEGSVVTISAVGSYRVSGSLSNGQLIVDTGEDPVNVTLILDGAQIRNDSGPALWIKQAKNVHLQLDGEDNLLVSGTEADLAGYDDTRSGAALYAEDDLIIDNGGSLTVKGYLNNGITCKDDFRQDSGIISIEAANNGLRASESITVTGGTLNVRSGNDGLKTSSADKEGKGFIELSGGDVNIECGGDGISAVTTLTLSGGTVNVSIREDVITSQSRKGLKAAKLIDINGGTTKITVDDDGIRCDGDVVLSGGTVTVVAATGIQAGEKDSGVGNVKISGGTAFICAVKQAVKAEGAFVADSELVALCGSEKQALPGEGSEPFILASVEGSAGDEVLLNPGVKSFTAALHYRTVLYTSPDLTRGESYLLACGSRNYTVTAR